MSRCRLALALAAWMTVLPATAATVDPFGAPASPAPQERTDGQDPPRDAADPTARPDPDPPSRTTTAEPPAAPAPAPAPASSSSIAAPAPAAGLTSPTSSGSQVCSLSIEAAPLLREASSRGIRPRVIGGSNCDINPADNEFFGGGGSAPCLIRFSSASWLRRGARLTGLTGVGDFEARVTDTGVEVSIPAEGGVRFRRFYVSVVRTGATCPAPRPANVLAD